MATQITQALSKKFEKRLQEELKIVLQQIAELKEDDPFADPDHASDNAAVDTDVREQVGHDTIEAQIKDVQKRLENIKTALSLIQKRKYGECEKCSKPIPLARLELVPEARFCVECENKLRK